MPRSAKAARSADWHIAGWPVILLAPIVLPIALLLRGAVRIFRWKGTRDRTPKEVAGYIEDFIEGWGGEWDWDDFTSIPIANPWLDAIRRDAERVKLPVDEDGKAKLRELLVTVRSVT